MKKYTYMFLVALLLIAQTNKKAIAQTETEIENYNEVTLDVLTVPNSPAFNLLGISPSDVDRPTTPNDFAISIANATSNFSIVPKNYAIEFLPISFFPKSRMSYQKFTNDSLHDEVGKYFIPKWNQKLWNNISQTFLISAGISTDDSVKTTTPDFIKTRSGIGFKFSLVRGKIDKDFEDYKKSFDIVRKNLIALHEANDAFMSNIQENDSVLKSLAKVRLINTEIQIQIAKEIEDHPDLKKEKLESLIEKRNSLLRELEQINRERDIRTEFLKAESKKDLLEEANSLKSSIEQIKFKRYGWLLDFAGGMVLGFKNDDIQNSVVQQYAFWFNGGYSCQKGFSFLGLARYSNRADAIVDAFGNMKDEAFYDFGAKIEFQSNDDKFALNGEIINRNSPDNSFYRYTFNASYQVGLNQALTFSVGKSFEGTPEYGGNLIASLNFIKTFGSKRSIVNDEN